MVTKSLLFVFLIVISIFGISSFAASVNVTRATYQAEIGALVYVYFETANGGTTTPATNTAQTQSSSSGSFKVSKGSSTYLWSPQFASTATVSQGTWVLDLWASCTTAGTISVSIYTTTSSGTSQSTILNGGTTSIVPTSETQIVNSFSGSQGTIPASGYIEMVLTVSRTCTIYWGSGSQTNFQVPFSTLST
ncbi:MAG: hypothetical protein PXY39_04100 [archaeon]|nr:hypothetical protein [archaeon]